MKYEEISYITFVKKEKYNIAFFYFSCSTEKFIKLHWIYKDKNKESTTTTSVSSQDSLCMRGRQDSKLITGLLS